MPKGQRGPPKPSRDDLPSLKVSVARMTGLVTQFMDSAEIEIGGHKARVGLYQRVFHNDGNWTFFVCPTCSRNCQKLRLYDGRFCCAKCLKLPPAKRPVVIKQLLARVARQAQRKRRGTAEAKGKELEWKLRRARLAERKERLKGWPPKA